MDAMDTRFPACNEIACIDACASFETRPAGAPQDDDVFDGIKKSPSS
jgi:hypothetical protein